MTFTPDPNYRRRVDLEAQRNRDAELDRLDRELADVVMTAEDVRVPEDLGKLDALESYRLRSRSKPSLTI